VKASIQEYLPENPADVKLLQRAEKLAEERYYALPEDKRPEELRNFVRKYAPAIVYQELRSHKAAKSYSGFGNIVHLSSGIVRAFLDCCSRMYVKCMEDGRKEPTSIPLSVQAEVVAAYADEYIEKQLRARIGEMPRESPERQRLEELWMLLQALGKAFRARLMDKNSREPRIISISLKDAPDKRLEEVLRLAEREAFLHRKWYRAKTGDRNLECYVLNRRLCPHFNLDLTGFQGRVEVSASVLAAGLKNRDALLPAFKAEDADGDGQLEMFEW